MKWVAGFIFCVCAVAAGAPPGHVRGEVWADAMSVGAGRAFTVGVLLHVDAGWHVYWTNPGDAGGPTTVKLTLPAGFKVGAVQYPVPEVLPQEGGLTVYGYEKEVMLMATVTPPDSLAGVKSVPITAAAGWCVCNPEVCVLGKQQLEMSLPVGGMGEAANERLFSAWRGRMPVAAEQVFASISGSGAKSPVMVTFTWKNDPPAAAFEWIPGASDDLSVKAADIVTTGRTTVMHLTIGQIQGIVPTSSTISGLLAYHVAGEQPGGVAVTLDRKTMEAATAADSR